MTTGETPLQRIARFEMPALIIGVVGLIAFVVLGLHDKVQLLHSYLFAYVFWVGVPFGCTAITFLHYLIGGTWGFPIRRPLEAATKTLPMMAVLVLPIMIGASTIYPWANPDIVKADAVLQYKHAYLNLPFFWARTAFYFAFLIVITTLINTWSKKLDETGDPSYLRKSQVVSGPGMLIFGLIVTFACLDWVMTLEPHWISSIYGLIFMVSQALAAMSLLLITVIFISSEASLNGWVTKYLLNDYGNLLLTFTILWAYLSFSQFLIIWGGNLREEVPWYMARAKGAWVPIALFLIIFHFAVPLFLLFMRFVKRRAQAMTKLAAWLFLMSILDIFWLTVPSFEKGGPEFHLTDILAVIGLGGLWFWRYFNQLKGRTLLPMSDPRVQVLTEQKANLREAHEQAHGPQHAQHA